MLVPLLLMTAVSLATAVPVYAQALPGQPRSHGDVLEMQRHDTPVRVRAALDLPPRGTTMQQVRAQFGPPHKTYAPVGDPPITRWDYPGLSMYFEYNLFLHAVVPADPEPLVHTKQLLGGR